LNFISQP